MTKMRIQLVGDNLDLPDVLITARLKGRNPGTWVLCEEDGLFIFRHHKSHKTGLNGFSTTRLVAVKKAAEDGYRIFVNTKEVVIETHVVIREL